jgi:hypothetical protein
MQFSSTILWRCPFENEHRFGSTFSVFSTKLFWNSKNFVVLDFFFERIRDFYGFYPKFEKKILKNTEKRVRSFGFIVKHVFNKKQ